MLDAELSGGLGDTRFVTDQHNRHILQLQPGLNSIPLDDIDMRVGERLGGRKYGQV
jgi:hypothetical protein